MPWDAYRKATAADLPAERDPVPVPDLNDFWDFDDEEEARRRLPEARRPLRGATRGVRGLATGFRRATWEHRGGRRRAGLLTSADQNGPLCHRRSTPARTLLVPPTRRASATSASSPTSTTASRPWPTGCCSSPGWSTRGRCARSTSTGWTSSASAASRSRARPSGCRGRVREGERTGEHAVLNMIDTPGHVDFTYEVSRRLAACEGAVLLVDAAQGIEAQTLANLYLALENDLHDHPGAQQDRPAGRPAGEVRRGAGPPDRLRARTTACGSPARPARACRTCSTRSSGSSPRRSATPTAPARAMIFDSVYDVYRGVVTYVRVIDGRIERPRPDQDDVHRRRARAAGDRRHLARDGEGRRARRRRGRLPDHRREGRPPVPGRRHRHHQRPAGHRGARRLQGPEADGLLGPLPDRRLRLPEPARRAGQAQAQRRRARLRAGDLRRRSASASAAASSACCTWRSSGSGWSASSTST